MLAVQNSISQKKKKWKIILLNERTNMPLVHNLENIKRTVKQKT